jgi:hypothetical protein
MKFTQSNGRRENLGWKNLPLDPTETNTQVLKSVRQDVESETNPAIPHAVVSPERNIREVSAKRPSSDHPCVGADGLHSLLKSRCSTKL